VIDLNRKTHKGDEYQLFRFFYALEHDFNIEQISSQIQQLNGCSPGMGNWAIEKAREIYLKGKDYEQHISYLPNRKSRLDALRKISFHKEESHHKKYRL